MNNIEQWNLSLVWRDGKLRESPCCGGSLAHSVSFQSLQENAMFWASVGQRHELPVFFWVFSPEQVWIVPGKKRHSLGKLSLLWLTGKTSKEAKEKISLSLYLAVRAVDNTVHERESWSSYVFEYSHKKIPALFLLSSFSLRSSFKSAELISEEMNGDTIQHHKVVPGQWYV